MAGAWHHNTSETACAKLARFVLSECPPPRRDTPFWIIANSYQQCCNVTWKEKLFGHGHIPPSEIDYRRVRWYKPNQNWPFEVPLKPWPGRPGKNWSLNFKSYSQGRAQMQGESIGGFLFVEQFPWGLLEETLRGCREYNYPGSKFAEFTPIDPSLSASLEEMIDNDRLPPGWKIYRANTECALEAGHISESWYHEFFGTVPKEMLLTRQIGAFASYEGAIYQSFSPHKHLVGDDRMTMPPGCQHRRAIDWGAGPQNAFVCLWGYRNGWGQWSIYDEYWSTDQRMTLHDHLKVIQDRHPWPEGNPHYGTTWADPSDPGNLRIAARLSQYCPGYDNISISPANNNVLEGIDYVRVLLEDDPTHGEPKLLIHKENCPNLCREMRTYRWERGSDRGLNPRDARPVPLKKDDHAVDTCRYLVFSEASHLGQAPEHVRQKLREQGRYGIQLARGGRA